MKTVKVKISYEPEADVLAWETGKQAIDYAEEVGNMIVHFSKNHKPVLVEILEASKFLNQTKKLVLSKSQHILKTSLVLAGK